MNRQIASLPLVLVVTACAGPDVGTTTRRIIEGQPSAPSDYPSTVAMLFVERDMEWGDYASVGCTGTLIAPDVVLTAAHCTVDADAIAMEYPGLTIETYVSFEPDLASFGLTSIELPTDAVEVTTQYAHPDFVGDDVEPVPGLGNDRDIGLLFLAQAVSVSPALLPTPDVDARVRTGEPVAIVGYGQRERQAMSELYGVKFHADTFVQDVGEFEMQVGGTIDSTTVGPSKCYGDSGGPTYVETDGGRAVIGVTSRSYNLHEECDEAGVDTRVRPFIDWIETTMAQGCDEGLRVDCPPGNDPPPMDPPKQPPMNTEPPMMNDPPATTVPPTTDGPDSKTDGTLATKGPESCEIAGPGAGTTLWLLLPMLMFVRSKKR